MGDDSERVANAGVPLLKQPMKVALGLDRASKRCQPYDHQANGSEYDRVCRTLFRFRVDRPLLTSTGAHGRD